jgi:glycosyltransferase involved in cell wall biosynthesis
MPRSEALRQDSSVSERPRALDPLPTIVVPVYRTPLQLVGQCLCSIARQTVGGYEVVVVDNGSGASYHRKLRAVVRTLLHDRDGRLIRLTHNSGPAAGRNAGAAAARGAYVAFVDSDDIVEPRLVEAIRPALRRGCAVAYTHHVHVAYDGRRVVHVRDKRVYQRLLERFAGTLEDPLVHSTFVHHCLIVQRDQFEAIGGFRTDLGYGEEEEVPMLIAERAGPSGVTLVPEVLYRYRMNPVSIMHESSLYEHVVESRVSIMVAAARRRGFPAVTGERLGRAYPTNAPQYAVYDARGERLSAGWFDYDALSIRPEHLEYP